MKTQDKIVSASLIVMSLLTQRIQGDLGIQNIHRKNTCTNFNHLPILMCRRGCFYYSLLYVINSI